VPTTGKGLARGVELSSLGDDERTGLRREKIGMVFLTFNLLPTLTAVATMALPLRLQSLSRKDAKRRATEITLAHR
jgi:putative ABC transport system ATP-binding protein